MANYETLNDLIIFYRLPFVDLLPLDFHWLYMYYIRCLYIHIYFVSPILYVAGCYLKIRY